MLTNALRAAGIGSGYPSTSDAPIVAPAPAGGFPEGSGGVRLGATPLSMALRGQKPEVAPLHPVEQAIVEALGVTAEDWRDTPGPVRAAILKRALAESQG